MPEQQQVDIVMGVDMVRNEPTAQHKHSVDATENCHKQRKQSKYSEIDCSRFQSNSGVSSEIRLGNALQHQC